ncbi:polysaccharide pyruvyl transferase family protein [Metabacillus sp. KIGAM252]|uniref:Polysaccharide pyruvyl transferase family protein n=1 Tax=Metabacillus flavus TaxID=2823519 RepID=A0ABS5LB84_9BACI|nr:polysaccharide pyruvyl transferase family protein [Metabacillus flavus]MBS2967896.1 polysaccharide pyruvyl transferase family protein [Metabacillus flavus]
MKKVLYLGWIGYKNLGDDLLWRLFKNLSKEHLNEKDIKIVPSLPGTDISKLDEFDTVVLGGGSLLVPRYMNLLNKALQKGKKGMIWGSGIDKIPKKQLDAIIDGKIPSMEKRLKGEEAAIFKKVFSQASFSGVRGPFTKKALEAAGIHQDHIQIAGDAGLLLTPKEVLAKRENTIGINWGTTYNNLYGSNEAELENKLVSICKTLIKKGYKIWIYTVWNEDRTACSRLLKKIDDPLNASFDKTLYSEQQLMTQLSACRMTINFKLHPNLLSLSAGVPCVFLGYRFKVFDLAYSAGLEEYALSTGAINLEEEVLNRVDLIEKNTDSILERYKQTQSKYRPLLIEPFEKQLYTAE